MRAGEKLKVLDLFSGIGGFSLGLERTGGFETVAFCEIEPFPRKVLAKHWPEVPIYEDVRDLTGERLRADGISVDVICGGFPCQDISLAGKGAGIEGERSGLWSEYARLVGELRPRFVIVENVAALLGRGLDRVLADLAEIGFDAEWHCIPASAVGAPHRRDRLWLVAHPGNNGHRADDRSGRHTGPQGPREGEGHKRERLRSIAGRGGAPMAYTDHARLEGWLRQGVSERAGERTAGARRASLADTACELSHRSGGRTEKTGRGEPAIGGWWLSEPDVGRVANGIPARVDRLKGLGNAVVPQIPELIGRAILESRRAA